MAKSKKKSDEKRKGPTDKTQDEVILKCDRVCALCWAFKRDGRPKMQGQLAHIERKSHKSQPKDLAWLCLFCHDLYDSTPRQTKKLRPAELRAYKGIVESLVEAGELPTYQSFGSGLLNVELEYACFMHRGGVGVCLETWCLFSNQGDKSCGIKRVSLQRDGKKFGERASWQRQDGEPVSQNSYHRDAEYLDLHRNQMVEPGQARFWAVMFHLVGFDVDTLHTLGRQEFRTIYPDPSMHLLIEPVFGSPIQIELEKINLGMTEPYD